MAPMILVSARVPLVVIWFLNWVGLGWGWASGVWGQGLTISLEELSSFFYCILKKFDMIVLLVLPAIMTMRV